MQVGPAITPIPEEALMLDMREYAAHPLSFLRKYLMDHGTAATQEFLARVQFYPFISDLFGEWLRRTTDLSQASDLLSTITREVIGSMTLSDLCSMLASPLNLLAKDGAVEPRTASGVLRELYLSSLALKLDAYGRDFQPAKLEQILSASHEDAAIPSAAISSDVPETTANYSDFLTELKEAGVIIPPSSKERTAKTSAKRTTIPEDVAAAPRPRPVKAKAVSTKSTAKVESLLSPEAREKVMTKIFREDQDDYRRSMDLIDNARDWKQASIYLDALFMRRKVDPYSKTATRLSDAVFLRFNSSR
jgi:hypothetical protein